jgi:hypothetical protein
MPTTNQPVGIDDPPDFEASYINWFVWANQHLDCDRETAHVTAAIASSAELSPDVDLSDLADLARLAAAGFSSASYRLRALAEWTYWAEVEFGASRMLASRSAYQAIAAIEAGSDLSVAMAVARAATQPNPRRVESARGPGPVLLEAEAAGTDLTGPAKGTVYEPSSPERLLAREQSPEYEIAASNPTPATLAPIELPNMSTTGNVSPLENRSPTKKWTWAIGAVLVVGVLVAFGVSIYETSPRVSAIADSTGTVRLAVSSFPPQSPVYFFRQGAGVLIASTTTDASGRATALWVTANIPVNVAITACTDAKESNCPAETLVFLAVNE